MGRSHRWSLPRAFQSVKTVTKWDLNSKETLSWLLLFWVSLSPGQYVILHCSLVSSHSLCLTLVTGIQLKSWALWQIHGLGQGFEKVLDLSQHIHEPGVSFA